VEGKICSVQAEFFARGGFCAFFFFFFFKERWILNFPIIQTAGCLGDNLKILKEKGVELPVLL
jgi:hypothetical protein